MIELILSGIVGYLLGSIPTGVLVGRALRGVDVRDHVSGHTGGLNVSRAAGLPAGAFTGAVDVLKGMGAVTVARLLTDDPWAVILAGVMAVVGHDWSIFLRFGGGIGLATLLGTLLGSELRVALPAAVLVLLIWVLLVTMMRVHRARATVIVMLLVGPILWGIGSSLLSPQEILSGVLGGVVVIVKTLPDWNRQYG